MNGNSRNFYEELFSPDTTDKTPEDLHDFSELISNVGQEYVFSGISMVHNGKNGKNNPSNASPASSFNILRSNIDKAAPHGSGSDMDISEETSTLFSSSDMDISNSDSSLDSISDGFNDSDSLSSSSQSYDYNPENVEVNPVYINDNSSISRNSHHTSGSNEIPPPVLSFLDEDEIATLLGENVKLPPIQPRETLEKDNIDIIASFNVRNKYDHTTAAELLINEKITFLSIQEPYASSHKAAESWKAFQKLELQTARISCYETPYQMILFDTWKWGGKVLTSFQSLQYGRIASISFNLGGSFKLGIISIYAPTKDSNSNNLNDTATHPSMKITNNLVQKIISKWKHNYPDMLVMILGDLQETVSTLDRDNLGQFRSNLSEEGVLANLLHSHTSIVRERNPELSYVTRFGKEGGRGIDHILFPSDDKFSHICADAKMKRDIGSNYFPSDHSMITCSIRRSDQNNNCSGHRKDKYDYSKLFSIKMRQSGRLGEEMDFDTSQFKNCKKYKDQAKLFSDIQERTNDAALRTKTHLKDLELRTDALLKNLWKQGIYQKIDNSSNKLVEISDFHAMELSYILKHFNSAVKLIMSDLQLAHEKNSNDAAGTTRGHLRKRKGFKIFNNLPVPTKLRYLKNCVEAKLKEITKNMYWLDEFHIRNTHEDEAKLIHISQEPFWTQWKRILKDDVLVKQSKEVLDAYNQEEEERLLHVAAIQFEEEKSRSRFRKSKKSQENNPSEFNDGNKLPSVSDNVTRLLNFWLANSNCHQGFNAKKIAGGSTAFLSHRILDWKGILTENDFGDFDLSLPHQSKMLRSTLEKAQVELQKLSKQLLKLQSFYRKSTLDYYLDTNNISKFTNKVSFKSKQAPAAHTSIWDASLMEFRNCVDEIEELHATSAFHGNWMANSGAKEICAFAEIISVGRLGFRGVKLKPDRKVSMADIANLIPNGNSLPREIKRAFIKAHGSHTANLFREPDTDNHEFYYPFFLLDEKGTMSNGDTLEKGLWKSLASIPSKARFEGFQLAVLGRFSIRWRKLLLKIIKLILIMRYVPVELKRMARFPIPKPGRQNEYRPISLCHDLYCYIMGVVTSYSSAAIERSGILHEGITAYQKGKGCANLVTTELCFREDCLESSVPSVQIDEDEEKFFDRIPVEILLAAMRINGFPSTGYIEIKASAMESKTVEIITAKGVTYARFVCGLEQGNPDSPTVSNLVIKFKHDIWSFISKDIKLRLEKNNSFNSEGYRFNSVDFKDGQVYICKIGYSDDNSKYISIKNEKDLLFLVRYFTQLSGDVSMVTKIGRKSAKCEVQFFNISAELAWKMKKVWSTAWSFVDDSPIAEQIPFKIHFKPAELKSFLQLSDLFNLPEEEQILWNEIIGHNAHKHLGLACTLGADTSTSWKKTIEKMKERLAKLNVYKMHISAQRKCFNMLVGTIPSFAPIQVNFPSKELLHFDRHAAEICMKSNGLSKSDSKIRMFLPESCGGLGLISTMELDIISVAREFEIVSNNVSLDSRSFRTRITALEQYPLYSIFDNRNHARDAITKLAKYGIYIRSSDEMDINNILAILSTSNKLYLPFNHPEYKDSCKLGIGLGKDRNLKLMYGGPFHKVLKTLKENKWKNSPLIMEMAKPYRIPVRNLLKIHSKISMSPNRDFGKFFSFWEWRSPDFKTTENIPGDIGTWKATYFQDEKNIQNNQESNGRNTFRSQCFDKSKIHWNLYARLTQDSTALLFNSYTWEGRMLKRIIDSKSPIIIATDGSHMESHVSSSTSSSFVLCILNIKEDEELATGNWMDRPVIPLMSRVSMLPQNFGSSTSDIAHGEFCALLFAAMAFRKLPRVTITDSKAIREQLLKIKTLPSQHTDRNYIRNIAGGIGKFVCGMMKDIHFHTEANDEDISYSSTKRFLNKEFRSRNLSFLSMAKRWTVPATSHKEEELSGWEESYFDDDISLPVLKVNSHQLDDTGTSIKNPPRYKKLIPNLAMLSANHHADVCAEYGRKFEVTCYNYNEPPSHLRYFLTCGGKHIDRNISSFCHEQFSQLKIRKLKLKKTQGLLWRILDNTTTTWEILGLHKGWRRSLLGLSSTHSRRIYKSEVYRECCKAKLFSDSKNRCLLTTEFNKCTTKMKIDILKNCAWCTTDSGNNDIGNRNHAILYCKHDDLRSFRIKNTNLIESKFRIFFLDLAKATNQEIVNVCIRKVETTFLDLQNRNVDRLTPIPSSENNRYLPIKTLLSREKLSNVSDALNCHKFNFCCELFGLIPKYSNKPISDDQIGLVDCTWLGLVPKSIDEIMKAQCDNISEFISHKETATYLSNQLNHSWQEIRSLIMGKAIGTHRVINSTGKRLEKSWRKEFNIDINTIKKLKKDSNPIPSSSENKNSASKSTKKRKFGTNGGIPVMLNIKKHKIEENKETKQTQIKTPSATKSCTGITCNCKYGSWYSNNNFCQNQIKTSIRQCQRCSRYMTAIKFCATALEQIESSPNENFESLILFIKNSHNNLQHKYFSFAEKFNACFPETSNVLLHTNSGKTKRISDRFKLISNLFCVTISKATHDFLFIDGDLPRRALLIVNNLISCKESDFNLDREAETKIKLLTNFNKGISCTERKTDSSQHNRKSIKSSSKLQPSIKKPKPTTIQIAKNLSTGDQLIISTSVKKNETFSNDPLSKPPQSKCAHEKKNVRLKSDLQRNIIKVQDASTISNKISKPLHPIAATIIRPHRYLSGEAMTRAIEILRSYKVQNVYFASAEAVNQIASWRLNDGWTKFAKMFSDRNIIHNKLNGIYFIPLFSGETSMGHWSLCVIKKISQRNIEAWCVDSLGKGNTNGPTHSKITTAFAPGRAKMIWKPCRCRCQEEVECGPRTILAMKIILDGISNNTSMETNIEKATMTQFPHVNYTSSMIREKNAHLVNLFTPDMITPPIRLRERGRRRILTQATKAANTRENPCEILD